MMDRTVDIAVFEDVGMDKELVLESRALAVNRGTYAHINEHFHVLVP